ncbi:MAG: hydrogenase-4 component G [Arcobacter sp.]|jgi:DNA-binding protein YbaB|uniref:hydrogenase-4 component G n=1 Tax=Arcobacter sp. TaxID=1872629 RepID=UPI00258F9436|nr:hydrogenase-4 component G [Arcobacter sp.]MDD3007954.1 hydrogenase-4 component G [Arcobacter sp.]
MQVQNSTNMALNAFKQNQNVNANTQNKQEKVSEKSLEETINESAVKVSISMNAQYILFAMNTSSLTERNALTQAGLSTNQQEVLDFLSGKETSSGMSLKNIGYEGKPITELTPDEAKELISDDGFFGVTQTSDRVANFVFSFAGDDLELLQKGREGIVQGFEEAKKMFGGELPEISYKTQERTLALIDEKINSLKGE